MSAPTSARSIRPLFRLALALFSISLLALSILPSHASAGEADVIVQLINLQYGSVCDAKITGWFSKTLKIDWTARTNTFHAMKVLAEIGTVKEKLYVDGVRYFQFPNDAGTYNVINW